MSDSNSQPKVPSIPEWQKKPLPSSSSESELTSTPPSPPADTSNVTSEAPQSQSDQTTSREVLLEQATKFLEDDSIRDASTDKKITFLESKGLTNDEIQQLLGVSRNPDASSTVSPSASPSQPQSQKPLPASPAMAAASASVPISPNQQSSTKNSPPDVPPIVTYPEFLLRPSKPPPLITPQRLLYTLYAASGLAASIYGTSKFLVTPMLASLNDARHDLAETTLSNLEVLNTKLEGSISVIPPRKSKSSTNSKHTNTDAEDSDSDTIDSDPTELFHRDIATQTTEDLPAPQQTSASTSTSLQDPTNPLTLASHPINKSTTALLTLRTHLSDFLSLQTSESSTSSSTKESLSTFHHYLDTLRFKTQTSIGGATNSAYPSYLNPGYGVYGEGTPGGTAGDKDAKKEVDAFAEFRSDIRSVKGALLSARNFPGAAR